MYVIYLKGRLQRERKREITFSYWFTSPNSHNGQVWARQKTEASTPSGSPIWVQGPKLLGHPFLCSQAHSQGTKWEAELLGLKLVPIWDARKTGNSLTCCTPTVALE